MNNPATTPDLRSANALWASVLVETLVRAGVRHAVISPGSRSTPLTIAFARHPAIKATPVLDERSAGFFALGLAKVSGRPVVLVCTSGTAAANYFPAIVEAHESGVPLLVITADRPAELRACASGQTIDQQKLYGEYVSFFHELAVPDVDAGRLRYLRQTVLHAVSRTCQPAMGVVHLNAPFRDPLPPLDDGGVAAMAGATIDWTEFFAHIEPLPGSVGVIGAGAAAALGAPIIAGRFSPEAHGLIVLGPNQPADVEGFVDGIAALADRLGWPVLADGLTPLRNYADRFPRLVSTYDTILRQPSAAQRLKPEIVLCIGGWPTSKVLRSWLEANDAPGWIATDRPDNRDALHGRTRRLPVGLGALTASLPDAAAPTAYQRLWLGYEARARAALDQRLGNATELVEPRAAWLLAQHLPTGTPLFIANSMPIRDVEYIWPPGNRAIRPFCNRGANGIDGTLSTAVGVAEATGRPTVLLTGDLALLHDTNGFLLAAKSSASLTIVLINNHGGGIFEHLPIAQFDPPFEEFFATPQEADFGKLCAAYGVEATVATDWAQFVDIISALPPSGMRLVELRTDRARDAALRKKWFGEIAAHLA